MSDLQRTVTLEFPYSMGPPGEVPLMKVLKAFFVPQLTIPAETARAMRAEFTRAMNAAPVFSQTIWVGGISFSRIEARWAERALCAALRIDRAKVAGCCPTCGHRPVAQVFAENLA